MKMIQCYKCGALCGKLYPDGNEYIGGPVRYMCEACHKKAVKDNVDGFKGVMGYIVLPWVASMIYLAIPGYLFLYTKKFLLGIGLPEGGATGFGLLLFVVIAGLLMYFAHKLIWCRIGNAKRIVVCVLCPPLLLLAVWHLFYLIRGKMHKSK